VSGLRVGLLVCYESAFPWLARGLAAAGADLLVNLANDAWFEGTPALAQSLAHAQMRAIETRLPVVRVANNGISAVIAPSGRVQWTSRPSEPGWHVAEVALGHRARGGRRLTSALRHPGQRSSGRRPVRRATRVSIGGPISSAS
jgi:apolipoprotein N-acyltransferase